MARSYYVALSVLERAMPTMNFQAVLSKIFRVTD